MGIVGSVTSQRPNMIKTANEVINKIVFRKGRLQAELDRQEDVTANLGMDPRVSQDRLNAKSGLSRPQHRNGSRRIHIMDKLDDTVEIGDNEIIVLRELPLSLPPVRGIIVAKPSSPLSHINILAKGWNIPNVYIKDADKLFREYNTYVFKLEANLTDYKLEPGLRRRHKTGFESPDQQVPPADLKTTGSPAFARCEKRTASRTAQSRRTWARCFNPRLAGITIPDGFSIPYYWYDKFMKDNGFYDRSSTT